MATDTLVAGFPDLDLLAGMTVTFEAINPTTGAAVGGVVISAGSIYGRDLGAGDGANPPLPLLVPSSA